MLVQHHEKYEEIHGEDKIVMMECGEHQKLHRRLRVEGKCDITPQELAKISTAAHGRTVKRIQAHSKSTAKYHKNNIERISFSRPVDAGISIRHRIIVNSKTGTVFVDNRFAHQGRDLIFIDIGRP